MKLVRKVWIQAALFKLQTPTYKNRIIGPIQTYYTVQKLRQLYFQVIKFNAIILLTTSTKKCVFNMLTRV